MYCFCTYFDQNYLSRGLALYRSLRKHCPDFKIWVLCMDQATYEILKMLDLPGMYPVTVEKFERNDELLLSAKQNRSKIEYYFTCTPSLPLYIFKNWPEVDLITYLDADLYFFASPTPLFEELGKRSIAIIGHRFPPHLRDRERYGIYNVGWLTFRRDKNALDCLKWWRDRCIEWCYDRAEDGRFADQKYLDDWPNCYKNIVVLAHKGANLAPWNVSQYHLHHDKSGLLVDTQPLIFFHFHGVQKITNWLYDPLWIEYSVKSSKILRKKIYAVYLKALIEGNTDVFDNHNYGSAVEGRYKIKWQRVEGYSIIGVIRRMKNLLCVGIRILMGRYILVLGRRIL